MMSPEQPPSDSQGTGSVLAPEGTLATMPLPQLLFAVCRRFPVAAIALRSTSGEAAIHVRGAFAVGVELPGAVDRLGEVLVAAGSLDAAHLDELAAPPPGQRSGELLVSRGVISAGQLHAGLRLQLRRRLHRLFFLDEAEYAVSAVDPGRGDEGSDPIRVDLLRAIYQGVRSAWSEARFGEGLRAVGGRPVRLVATPEVLTRYGLGPDDVELVQQLAQPRTLAELAALTGRDLPSVQALVYALLSTEAVAIGRGTPVSSRSPGVGRAEPTGTPHYTPSSLPRYTPSATRRYTPAHGAPSSAAMAPRPPSTPRGEAVPEPIVPETSQARTTRATPPPPARQASAPPSPAPPPAAASSSPRVLAAATSSTRIPTISAPPPTPPSGPETATAPPPLKAVTMPRGSGPGASSLAAVIAEKLAVFESEDYFAVLGVARDAPVVEIKSAYLAAARTFHPDRVGAAGPPSLRADAERVFRRMSEAYATLTDDKRREAYLVKIASPEAEAHDTAARQAVAAEMAFLEGEHALKQRDFRAALEKLAQAVQLSPTEGEAVALYAWARFSAGQITLRDARPDLERATEMSPRCARAFYFLGMALKDDDASRATAAFRRAVELDGRLAEAQSELRLLTMRASKERGETSRSLLDRFRKK